jgi:hypothetical protein
MEWCRLTIADDANALPDILIVDVIARLALNVRRAGGRLVIDSTCDELAELFDLAGLGIQVQWEAERREQPLRIEGGQEDRQLGDLPT